MGKINTAQAVEIIEAVTATVDAATPDEVVNVAPDPNYWWALALLLIPIWFAWWLKGKK